MHTSWQSTGQQRPAASTPRAPMCTAILTSPNTTTSFRQRLGLAERAA